MLVLGKCSLPDTKPQKHSLCRDCLKSWQAEVRLVHKIITRYTALDDKCPLGIPLALHGRVQGSIAPP